MSGKRHIRLGHQIRDEISGYIQRGLLKDPRIGFASVSGVRMSKDLRHAKVFISVLGPEEEGEETIEALQHARNFVRRQLGKDLRVRRVPDITFVRDDSIAEGIRISHLIDKAIESSPGEDVEDTIDEDSEVLSMSLNPNLPAVDWDDHTPLVSAPLTDEVEEIHTPHVKKTPAELTDWAPIVEAIRGGQTFLLSGHRHPDGDSLGAISALYGILESLGKSPVLFNDTPLPEHFLFLPHANKLQTSLDPDASFDVTILCDCGSVNRAPNGFPGPEQRGTLIVIDHHLTSQPEGDVSYNDPAAAAVGMLIYDLAKELEVPLTRDLAVPLYTALMSDTGSFRYDKTNPHVLRVAAELLEAGVRPWEIASSLYESVPMERQRLLALALDTLELELDGLLATLEINTSMLEQTGATAAMSDGFINFARGVKGVEVAVMFREQEGGWKLSFRSRGNVDVSAIASKLGGGGHKNAAGAFLVGDRDEIKRSVCQSVDLALQQEPSLAL